MREQTAIVFDLDDTLYPERRFLLSGYAAVATQVAAETGLPAGLLYRFLVNRFRACGRERLFQALCAAYALPIGDVARLVETIRTHVPRLRLPRMSRRLLAELRSHGHRLAVLTNGLPATQRGKVAALGLAPLVDVIVYAQECAPEGKPARACFTTVLHRLGVEAHAAVFVGDHPHKDIAGAAAAGLRTIWMPGRQQEPVPPAADAVAGRLADVPPLVACLLGERHVGSR